MWGWLWDLPLFSFNFFFGGFVFFFLGESSSLGVSLFKQIERGNVCDVFTKRRREGEKRLVIASLLRSLSQMDLFVFFNPPSYNNTNTIPLILYYYYFYYCWETNIFIIIFTSSK